MVNDTDYDSSSGLTILAMSKDFPPKPLSLVMVD